MRTVLITLLTIAISTVAYSQAEKNIFRTYEEFKENKPSEFAGFQLKKRTGFDIFMTGGIANYRLKKIAADESLDKMRKEIWGVFVDDTAYINSYPYSEIIGFNKIIENGYYSYFIGEPGRLKDKQISLGFIKPDQRQKAVCCKTSYVILPNGDVKWLTPELLAELIKDNQDLSIELNNDKMQQEDAYKMFDYLRRYNDNKK